MSKARAFHLQGESGEAGFDHFGDGKALGLPNSSLPVQWGMYQDDSQAPHSATLQGDKGQLMSDETGYEEKFFHSENSQASLHEDPNG